MSQGNIVYSPTIFQGIISHLEPTFTNQPTILNFRVYQLIDLAPWSTHKKKLNFFMMNKCYVRDYLNMKECNDVIETLICDLWCIIDMVLFHYM